MKKLAFIALILNSALVYSRPCQVYGISDSPQKLDCSFKSKNIALRCKSGTYYLDKDQVNLAFHMEVEEGPVPLVFKTDQMQLIVMMHSKYQIDADLEQNNKVIVGKCFL